MNIIRYSLLVVSCVLGACSRTQVQPAPASAGGGAPVQINESAQKGNAQGWASDSRIEGDQQFQGNLQAGTSAAQRSLSPASAGQVQQAFAGPAPVASPNVEPRSRE